MWVRVWVDQWRLRPDTQVEQDYGNYSDNSAYGGHTLPSLYKNPDFVSENPYQRRSNLVKRGGVYGPAISIPVGKFFCPPPADGNEGNGGADCKSVEPPWGVPDLSENERRSLDTRPRPTWEQDICTAILMLIDGTPIALAMPIPIPVAIVILIIEIPNANVYGYEEPDNCNSFAWGNPLAGRVTGSYNSEHLLILPPNSLKIHTSSCS
ncbi:hypothetical protein DL98DRAFT_589403 [Cadophora sp. DSE1049]|nr:hypothetical protein DL98DRAFT_589403 [Cadophora sp. DSE1049]